MNPFSQTLRNFYNKILILLFSLIFTLLIPALLGPELFGLYSLQLAWVGFLLPLTSFGIGSGIIYYISNKSYSFQSVLSSNFYLGVIIGLMNVAILIILIETRLIRNGSNELQFTEIFLFAGSTFIQSLNFIVGRALLGDSKFDVLNAMDLINSLLTPLVLIVLIWVMGKEKNSFIYLSYFITSLLVLIYSLVHLRIQGVWKSIDSTYINKARQYGIKSWLGDVALRANLRLDQLVLGSFISLHALGVYNVAVRLIELIWLIPDAMGPVLFNLIAGNPDPKNNLKLMSRIHRTTLAVCLVLMIIWIAVCQFIVTPLILGEFYGDVPGIVVLLAPGILFIISSKILTKLFSASGKVILTSKITIAGSLISVIFYFLLIPQYGITGAAIASTLGYFCLALAAWIALRQHYPVTFRDYFLIKNSDLVWLKSRFREILNSKTGNTL